MATKEFGVNNPLTNKIWSKKLAVAALADTYIDKFTGEGDDNMIDMVTEAEKRPGDRITCGLALDLEGRGVGENEVQEGNEEAVETADDSFNLGELSHATAVKAKGTLSAQRVPYDMRELALKQLSKWWVRRKDWWAANQLAGNTASSGTPADRETTLGNDTYYTGMQATVAPDANHVIRAGGVANDQSLTSNDIFHLGLIDIALEKAKTVYPIIRPLKYNGRDFYVCLIHPHQSVDLQIGSTSNGSWYSIEQALLQGGDIVGNPLFTGALGIYKGVIVQEWNRLPHAVNASTGEAITTTRRAVFCGAQAAWLGYGQGFGPSRFKWVEKLFDYNRKLGVSAACIGGLKSSRFTLDGTATDFGKIVISTYATAHTDA